MVLPATVDMDGLGTEIGRGLERVAPSLGAELGKGLEALGPLLSSAVEAAVGKNKERDLEKVSSLCSVASRVLFCVLQVDMEREMHKLGLDRVLPVTSWPDVHAARLPYSCLFHVWLLRRPFSQVRELKTEIKKLKKDHAVEKPLPFAELKKCVHAPTLYAY